MGVVGQRNSPNKRCHLFKVEIRRVAQPRPFNIKMKLLIVLSVFITLINVALAENTSFKGHSCEGCLFTNYHEWARVDGDIATVGVTDITQYLIGEIISIDLPYIGTRVESGERLVFLDLACTMGCGSVDVYSPFTGTVIEVNSELENNPMGPIDVNDKPYDDGWMVKIKLEDLSELEGLMSEQEYLLKNKEEFGAFN